MRSFYGRTGIEIRDTLTEGLEMMKPYIQEACVRAVEAGGEVIRQRAWENANVSPGLTGHCPDGGHMRDKLKVTVYQQPPGASARIGIDQADCPYAAHQEFGPHGNAFLRRAIDETRDDVHDVVASTFERDFMAGFDTRTAVRFRRFA